MWRQETACERFQRKVASSHCRPCELTKRAEALVAYTLAAELFHDQGRYELAARQHKNIAEMCEQELMYEQALQHYQTARDLFKREEKKQYEPG